MTFLIGSLRKRISLSLGALDIQTHDFLIESLRKRTSLSLGAPEVQMQDFLNGILKETDQSERGSSGAPNA